MDNILGSTRKVAWVVGDPHDFKLVHQLCALGRLNHFDTDRKEFRDIAKAKEWLNIPADYEIKFPDE